MCSLVCSTMILLVMLLFSLFKAVDDTRGVKYSVNHGGYRYAVSNVLFLFAVGGSR